MLRLFDTPTRETREPELVAPGRVSMYSCGPTVYRFVHIGNLRTFLLADVLRRALAYHGLAVRSVMNITDVGHMTDELSDAGRDRMLLAADDEGLSPTEIAQKYTEAFLADTRALNILPADAYPRASEHIDDMIDLARRLVEAGHAYERQGTVYYDVTSFPGYGRLSGQALEDMQAAHRLGAVDPNKRSHQDFVLWKAAGPRREAVFESPWGLGYPGWHIECAAMLLRHLGEEVDLHTGGIDLRFPHHEDEIAMSEGAVGHPVVRHWVHGEHLLTAEAKMAKSAGNVITLRTLTDEGHDPLAFRYLCFTARYRRQFHFAPDALEAAGTALRRLRERIAALGEGAPTAPPTDPDLRREVTDDAALVHHRRFMDAVDDDLDLPRALTILGEMLGEDALRPETRRTLAASWDWILGLDLVGAEPLPAALEALLREREEARERRDFEAADAIRDRLAREGVELIDTAEGTRWVRRGP